MASTITRTLGSSLRGLTLKSGAETALDKFVGSTGAHHIDDELLERFETLTGHKPHRYLRRGIVFCHRDLNLILDKYEQGRPIYLKTGRGPSSDSLHIGHSIPFEFTKWLQDVFGAKLVIMLTDDMKLLHNTKLQISDVRRYTTDNAKDILAFGFDQKKTFMFSNLDFVGGAFYQNIIKVARQISVSSIKSALGFNDEQNVGMFYCCSTQSAGCFATSFPGILSNDQSKLEDSSCMIACSYDIDGYFTEVRKHAEPIGYTKPAFMYSSLLPSLQGVDAKMSASVNSSAVFLTDSQEEIRSKLEAAFPLGDMDTDVPIQWLKFFLEDDRKLADLEGRLESKDLSNTELRETLIVTVQDRVKDFQQSRASVTNDLLQSFMAHRLLE